MFIIHLRRFFNNITTSPFSSPHIISKSTYKLSPNPYHPVSTFNNSISASFFFFCPIAIFTTESIELVDDSSTKFQTKQI